jgi:hypothetical protein
MKQFIICMLVLSTTMAAKAQNKFAAKEFSVNGFRNPSIGLEYRYHRLSLHGGYYTTAFTSGEYTNFIKAGVTYWFLAVDNKEIPSSFYAGASYLYGVNKSYKNKSAVGMEAGFRWMAWKGLNLRIGVIAVAADGKSLQVNPTPGISYSFKR